MWVIHVFNANTGEKGYLHDFGRQVTADKEKAWRLNTREMAADYAFHYTCRLASNNIWYRLEPV